MYVSSCCDVVVLNVCGRVGLALGQACFLQSSGRLQCFGLASISIQRCSGKRQFPRGPCIAGRCRCRCRLFVRLRLDLSIWLVKRYTSLASIWPPLRRISLSTHIAPTTFTESEAKQTTYSLPHYHFRHWAHLLQQP